MIGSPHCSCFFFFNDTATTEIYTLSLHDALPIFHEGGPAPVGGLEARLRRHPGVRRPLPARIAAPHPPRSEEHTSELQSLAYLVCRLLLEKKKIRPIQRATLRAPTTVTQPAPPLL